ncbi:MAG: hypothetical protein EOP00_22990 [Pedobacter sp.]|nr:MAG: hypothetical protein EOP00_22990 [Pedobacter sp.]
MKIVLTLFLLVLFLNVRAQTENIGDYEVKVISYRYKTTKGHLKKVNAEGIGIEDYKGNYIIFRTADIKKIIIRKRGLTLGNAVASGTLLGLGIGGGIWSLDESGENATDMAKLTIALTATGAVLGTAVGGISELAKRKLTLKVKGNLEYFTQNYQRLNKYINLSSETLHVNN